jgi:hypothetical protein
MDHRMVFPQTNTANWKVRFQEEIEELAANVMFFPDSRQNYS